MLKCNAFSFSKHNTSKTTVSFILVLSIPHNLSHSFMVYPHLTNFSQAAMFFLESMHTMVVQCSSDGGNTNISQCEKGFKLLKCYPGCPH